MAKHIVKCLYCGEHFDTNFTPFIKVRTNRYAHQVCHDKAMAERSQEEKDKELLENYIKELFGYEKIPEVVYKQIKQYLNDYNYTYSGMYKTLKYHYEVKRGNIEKAYGRIGIVPYMYNEAARYYYAIWEAQQRSTAIIAREQGRFEKNIREVRIEPPKRAVMRPKRRPFGFLEGDTEV